MRRALLSVSDKAGVVEFGRGLVARGFELVSTGGTATALAAAGLPVTGVSAVTGFPEMMDGRVKTLHPKVHGGILARRHEPADLAAAEREGIGLVDVVVVNLYPFARVAADPDAPFDHLIEQIDIGGPSLVRAAAKNFRDVLVVVDPADYPAVLAALDRPAGPDAAFRFDLARRAIAHTAAYDTTIAQTLDAVRFDDGVPSARRRRAGAGAPGARRGEAPRPALRRESASAGGVVRRRRRPGPGRRDRRAGQGAVLHQPARPRCRGPHRPRVRRAGRRGDQAHQPVRRRHRRPRRRGLPGRA